MISINEAEHIMDVSILIVNYNTVELTIRAIESVYRSETTYQYELILIDNASSDGSVERIGTIFPDLKLIANEDNVGFAIANNQGMRIAQGRYVLLLNSDTEIESDTLQVMMDYMDRHPDVGASGCKVLLPDGSLDKACKRGFPTPSASLYHMSGLSRIFPKNPRFNQYQLGHLSPEESYEVDSLVGAFMVVRQATIDEVGLLDELFFMYGEDIDWCYRIKEAGWKIVYYPQTKIMHYKGASSRKKPLKIIYEFHRAMWLFHHKHYAKKYSFVFNGIVYSGIYAKLCLSLLINQLRKRGVSS